jgi:hypothetical protein
MPSLQCQKAAGPLGASPAAHLGQRVYASVYPDLRAPIRPHKVGDRAGVLIFLSGRLTARIDTIRIMLILIAIVGLALTQSQPPGPTPLAAANEQPAVGVNPIPLPLEVQPKKAIGQEADKWTLSDKIALISAIAGAFQFFALIATIQTMHRFSSRQLRAYVATSSAKLFLHVDGSFEPVIEFKNSGQTPAYDFRVALLAGFESYPLANRGKPPEDLRQSVCVVGAGGSHVTPGGRKNEGGDLANGKALLEDLEKRESVFSARGICSYTDIFKRKHQLHFQMIVGGPSGPPSWTQDERGIMFAPFSLDSTGNKEDWQEVACTSVRPQRGKRGVKEKFRTDRR